VAVLALNNREKEVGVFGRTRIYIYLKKHRNFKGGYMNKIRLIFAAAMVVLLVASGLLTGCTGGTATTGPKETTLYIGGTFSLTGAYAEDTAAVLAGFQDYAKYVNETKLMAPWRSEKFPDNVKLEVMWRDDELSPEKALTIYDELKSKMFVYRISASQTAMALMNLLNEDRIGATSMAAMISMAGERRA